MQIRAWLEYIFSNATKHLGCIKGIFQVQYKLILIGSTHKKLI